MKDVRYYNSDISVKIGDHVKIKNWSCFWKGWMDGRVLYVPGISKKNHTMEYNGLSWVCINAINGTKYGCVVHPDTLNLRKNVRFVSRSVDSLTSTPNDFEFNDDA